MGMFGNVAIAMAPPAPIWNPHPKQAEAIVLAGKSFELLFGGSAGGGKGGRCPDRAAPSYDVGMETKVLTPKGFRLIGDVQVGDQVCNPDGTTSRIIRITDNGPKQFYRVTLADGSTVEADEEHLWAISIAGARKRRKQEPPVIPSGLRPEDEWNLRVQTRCTIVNTVELMRLVARADKEKAQGLRPHYVQIPLANPLTMTAPKGRWERFSPYILGALVGDGGLSQKTIMIVSEDQGIIDRITAELPENMMLAIRPERAETTARSYGFTRRKGAGGDTANDLLRRDRLDGHHSWDKFIPDRIKFGTVEDRFAFVQGLMDTDGYMDDRGHVEYSTVSAQLANDMRDVLHSLGYRATLTTKTPTFTHLGVKKEGRLAYLLYIQGRHMDRLFHLPRKKERVTSFNGGDVEPWHRVVSVVPTEIDNSRCITVDNLNHLYVTDDYIVTHNSMFLRCYGVTFALEHRGAHIAIIRRALPMLKQTHGLHLPALIGDRAVENKTESTWTFPNGSVIRFVSLWNPGDEQAYKSAEFDLLLFDEVTELAAAQYTFMLTRLRSAHGHRAHAIATANPEGRGFKWVKRRWVTPSPSDLAPGQAPPRPGEVWEPPLVIDGEIVDHQPARSYLPAVVTDNPALMKSNPDYVRQLKSLPDSRLRRALLDGDWDAMDQVPGALWSQTSIDEHRVSRVPDLVRIVIGVDPSGSSHDGSDEAGVVAVGKGDDGHLYVLRDASGVIAPDAWAGRVVHAYHDLGADKVVAEGNFGGAMVTSTLKHADASMPVKTVTASRGKAVRAEPIAFLATEGRIHHVGDFEDLESELTTWTPGGGWSPGRLDAMVWACTDLMGLGSGTAWSQWLKLKADRQAQEGERDALAGGPQAVPPTQGPTPASAPLPDLPATPVQRHAPPGLDRY